MYSQLLVILSVICSLSFAAKKLELHPEIQELIDPLHEICSKKIGLTDAEIDAYVITNTEKKYKCYMNCMMMESGWMKPDGTLDYEQMKDHGSHHSIKDLLLPLLEKCNSVPVSNEECDTAYNFNVCMAQTAPEHYFLP